jgi:ligand-binding SRPBCC domain-containing protein
MKEQILEVTQWLPRSPEEIFPFFADAANLDSITPPWLHFRIRSPLPITMREGARIEYSIKLHGIPIRWKTNITQWKPPFMFVDEQVSGPYRLWHHTHTFEAKDGGTLCTDRVRYRHWGGGLVERYFVRPDVERIFAYRRERLEAIFNAARTVRTDRAA